MPAYEDPAHWLQKEAALPVNVDPGDSKLDDPEERARMARVFDDGLDSQAALCCRSSAGTRRRPALDAASAGSSGAAICSWCRAIPRSGLRLPLASLPHVPPEEYPYIVEQDPMEPRGELADVQMPSGEVAADAEPQAEKRKRRQPVRTAMSVELRDGVLCVFMPPVEQLEDYLELVAAVEATAEEMQIQVHVEGYAPPYDPRIEVIKVTPDPGVIEVNVQPAQNWREAVDITFGLYEDAAKIRLGANNS